MYTQVTVIFCYDFRLEYKMVGWAIFIQSMTTGVLMCIPRFAVFAVILNAQLYGTKLSLSQLIQLMIFTDMLVVATHATCTTFRKGRVIYGAIGGMGVSDAAEVCKKGEHKPNILFIPNSE